MMYTIRFTETAQLDATKLRQSEPAAYRKLQTLVKELVEHPRTGTGQVEQLRHYTTETWSRRINRQHRLVYQIHDDVVEVIVVSAYGHYTR